MGHLLGLNIQVWERLRLTGGVNDDPPCPYDPNTFASLEWQKISGCSLEGAPTETSFPGQSGRQCTHWDEFCMRDELMTGTITQGFSPMSRVTVGSLADIGYAVNYDAADPYTSADINPTCQCHEDETGEAAEEDRIRQLRGRSSWISSRSRRALSDEGEKRAVDYARSVLKTYSVNSSEFDEAESSYTTGSVAVVYFVEDNHLYSIQVSATDL